ncbi:MAG TPA: gamma-glutamylcyclotransferase [Chloroflexota bacterium]|nr:gamma-glutamylcyclotransferase [Chloroflexota bacterium]
MRVFLNGTAMSGGAHHGNIMGAPFLGAAATAPNYRFYAVGDRFPGLVPVDAGGASIAGELYDLDEDTWFNSLLPNEPPELRPGTIMLSDGSTANAMILELDRARPDELIDITEHGGWRAYWSSKGEPAR